MMEGRELPKKIRGKVDTRCVYATLSKEITRFLSYNDLMAAREFWDYSAKIGSMNINYLWSHSDPPIGGIRSPFSHSNHGGISHQ